MILRVVVLFLAFTLNAYASDWSDAYFDSLTNAFRDATVSWEIRPDPPMPAYLEENPPSDNCLGVPPIPRVIGGCEVPHMICVCGADCYWMQVCHD